MGEDRPRTAEDVKALVDERNIRFIRFWFTDILGQLKSFSINAAELDDAFEAGREQLLGAVLTDPDDLLDVGHADARQAQLHSRTLRLDVDHRHRC